MIYNPLDNSLQWITNYDNIFLVRELDSPFMDWEYIATVLDIREYYQNYKIGIQISGTVYIVTVMNNSN